MSTIVRREFQQISIVVTALLVFATVRSLSAAELPLLRVAHGAFNEKVLALRLGGERGYFHKHGSNVEIVDVHNGPMTILALEHLSLDPARDKISLVAIGDQSVLAQSLIAGKIDGAYLSCG